jgi:hypothetical protein
MEDEHADDLREEGATKEEEEMFHFQWIQRLSRRLDFQWIQCHHTSTESYTWSWTWVRWD